MKILYHVEYHLNFFFTMNCPGLRKKDFDIPKGYFDGAECCELFSSYIELIRRFD